MKLHATAFILLIIWSDMGITKNGGEAFESMQECREAWQEHLACWREELKIKQKYPKDWGQPTGFCIEGERLTAPGIIFKPQPDPKTTGGCG